MIAYYPAYSTLERAEQGGKTYSGSKRSGIYRVYRRLDGQFEIRSHTKQPVPAAWELVVSREFNPVTGDWIPIFP